MPVIYRQAYKDKTHAGALKYGIENKK